MLDDDTIRNLLLRTAARETDAFAQLYRLCAPLTLSVARRIVTRPELAEEVVHDVFVKIWQSASQFDPGSARPLAWIVAIARHRAIDLHQSADVARTRLAGDDVEAIVDTHYAWDDDCGDRLDAGRMRRWLRHCLDELRPAERQALVLAYHHGLAHGELARHLGRPLGTAKAWVRRGLDRLRECVERCAPAR